MYLTITVVIRSRLLKPFCNEFRTISLGIPYSLHPSFSYKTLPHLNLQLPLMVVRYCLVSHVISYQFPFWYISYGNHFISEVNFNLQFSQANGTFPCQYINMFNSLILNKLDIMQQQRMKPSKGSFKDILICEYEQQPKISEFSSPLHTPLLN